MIMVDGRFQKRRFFRPDEVAELLLVTKRTVYRMVQDGRLGGVDTSKRPCRIPREAVVKLFEPALLLEDMQHLL